MRGLALAIAAVAALATLAIGVVTWFVVHEEIERQIDHRIELETAALLEVHRTEGFERLIHVVQERAARSHPRDTGYLAAVSDADRGMGYIVTDAQGRRRAGHLSAKLPPDGWSEFVHFRRADGTQGVAQAMSVPLAGAGRLVVAADRAIVDRMDLALLRIFLAVLALVLLILGLTVAGFGHIVHLRLAAIRDSARAIMAGDLARRMPYEGTRSEFDQLAGELNRMLDRIGALVASLRQVSGDVAHDLRTPLTRLHASLERALTVNDTPAARDAIEDALSEAGAALDLFAAILAISEVEGQAARARFAHVELDAVARHMAEAYEPALEAAGVTLSLALEPATVLGDRVLLQQALANLLDNLVVHTPAGTRAALEVAHEGDEVRLTLRDDGPGVPFGLEPKIFERFVRVDPARSGPGHGLGLSLVSAIADAHDARLSARAAEPGLRIDLLLPAAAATPVPPRGSGVDVAPDL